MTSPPRIVVAVDANERLELQPLPAGREYEPLP